MIFLQRGMPDIGLFSLNHNTPTPYFLCFSCRSEKVQAKVVAPTVYVGTHFYPEANSKKSLQIAANGKRKYRIHVAGLSLPKAIRNLVHRERNVHHFFKRLVVQFLDAARTVAGGIAEGQACKTGNEGKRRDANCTPPR